MTPVHISIWVTTSKMMTEDRPSVTSMKSRVIGFTAGPGVVVRAVVVESELVFGVVFVRVDGFVVVVGFVGADGLFVVITDLFVVVVVVGDTVGGTKLTITESE